MWHPNKLWLTDWPWSASSRVAFATETWSNTMWKCGCFQYLRLSCKPEHFSVIKFYPDNLPAAPGSPSARGTREQQGNYTLRPFTGWALRHTEDDIRSLEKLSSTKMHYSDKILTAHHFCPSTECLIRGIFFSWRQATNWPIVRPTSIWEIISW